MDAPPSPSATTPAAPVPSQPTLETTWSRSAQLTAAFLMGSALTWLVVYALSCARFGSVPARLEHGAIRAYQIDLNHASQAELLQIPGVGKAMVGRIQAYRDEHGGFGNVEQLTEVAGVGDVTLERLQSWVRVEPNLVPPNSARVTSDVKHKTLSKKELQLTAPIDVNRATAEELQRLPGIGPKLSQRILDERLKGPFKSAEDLCRVSGIGPKTLERIRPYIIMEGNGIRLASADSK